MPPIPASSADKEGGLYRNIVKTLPFPLVIINPQGKILSHNLAFDRFFGDSLIHTGKNLGEYLAQDSLAVFLDGMAALVKKESPDINMDITACNASGQLQYLTLSAQLYNLSLEKDNIICLFQNVSDFMDENQQLRKEKDLAEQATRSKSAFLANMSHEIRTPIHTVTGMTELILETNLDDEQKEYVQQIRFAAEALLGLINDVLDFSKIEAGKLHIENIDFDLESGVENALDMQSLEAFKRGLEVVLMVPPDLPEKVRGDPIRLRQILTNLISNAIKFTRHGHILTRLDLVDHDGQGTKIRFEVKDTGIGIPDEKKALLFQAFSQVDASMTRKFGGTGLGLSICQSLVHLMGGAIGVESEAGKGATFWFTLPFPGAVPKAHGSSQTLSGINILITDDNPACRLAARQILESAGAQVVEASSGPEALEILRFHAQKEQNFQVALVDLEMPGMDGWQFASEINADKTINQTRLVLMNPPGKLAGEAKMKLLNWFDGYVSKPLKRRELLPLVQGFCDEVLDLPEADEEADTAELPEVPPQVIMDKQNIPESTNQSKIFRVLVAEDHFVNQKLFMAILKSLGQEAVAASDGKETVEKVKEMDPDLVFMDVQMPEMNGYDATRLLRSMGYAKPIVAVTANALKGDVDKCLQAGMNDYLAKPFQKKDVQALLEKWLNQDSSPQGDDHSGIILFDAAFALKVFMDDRDLLLSILREYLDRTPGMLRDSQEAIASGDLKQAAHIAHTLKGSSYNLGINRFGAQAAALESLIKEEDIQEPQKLAAAQALLESVWEASHKVILPYLE